MPTAYSRPRLPSRRIRDAGAGMRILEDYNALKRTPRRSSACATPQPGSAAQAAEALQIARAPPEAHDAHDTAAAHATATTPLARGQGWVALCARAMCFVHRQSPCP